MPTRCKIITDAGTSLISGRIPSIDTNGRLTNSADISGSGNRVVQASAAGAISAAAAIVSGKIIDTATITALATESNWTNNVYTGTALSGVYEGQYVKVGNYYYFAYSDNDCSRIRISVDPLSYEGESIYYNGEIVMW